MSGKAVSHREFFNQVPHWFFSMRENACCGARPANLFADRTSYEGKSKKYQILDICLFPARAALKGEAYHIGLDKNKNLEVQEKGAIVQNVFIRFLFLVIAIGILPITIAAIVVWNRSWDDQKKEIFDSLIAKNLNIAGSLPQEKISLK